MKRFIIIFLFSINLCSAQERGMAKDAFVKKVMEEEGADSITIKELFFSGLKEKVIQNYAQASDYFNQVIELDSANDAAFYELAYLYHSTAKEAEAEKAALKAVHFKPNNEWYWLLLADIYKKTYNIAELTNVFNQLTRIYPDRQEFMFEKANSLAMQGKSDEAKAIYNEIEKRFGSNEGITRARQYINQRQNVDEQDADDLEVLIKKDPDDIDNYIALSQSYFNEGKKDKALSTLQRAKEIDPANLKIQLLLADLYRTQGKSEEAYKEIKAAFEGKRLDVDSKIKIILSFFPRFRDSRVREQAEELSSNLAETYPAEAKSFSMYGDVLFQQQKFKEAKTAYKKSLELNDQTYQIWEQLIRIDITEGDYDSAIKDGEEGLTIFPNQAALYLYTGLAYGQRAKHEKAVSYLKNAISLAVDDRDIQMQAYSSLGDSYNELKKFIESDQSYDKALQINPDNMYTLNNYAYYLALRTQNLDKAEKMSLHSIELDPNNASFQDTYAWVLFKGKKYKEAKLWIEKSIANSKLPNPTLLEHYGDILVQLGETDAAIKQWQLAKDNGNKSETLLRKINEKKYIE